jgi:methylamine--corrinoid protein Co-methyltransferase
MRRVPFLDVIDRTFEGKFYSQEDFDMKVFVPELRKVVEKYKIKYDSNVLIPDDDDLADRIFQAGLEFYQKVGTYCVDTERVISFTEDEIRHALRAAPNKVSFGEGRDLRWLKNRRPDSDEPPFCFLGAVGVSVSSDEIFVKLIEAFSECELTDTITMPSLTQINGRAVRPNSPFEVMAAIRSVRLFHEGTARAGRPGIAAMNAIACASSDVAKIAGSHYLRPSDGWMIGSTAELKVQTARFNEIAYVRDIGGRILAETTPLFGGFCGGPEGVAVASVAYHLHGLLVLRGDCQLHCPLHLKFVCATAPPVLWALSAGTQAITRNSHSPIMISPFLTAGAMEEMCFLEAAAAVTAIIVSGSNLEAQVSYGGATTDLTGPLTPQFSAEVGHAVAGMTRTEANGIVSTLVDLFKADLGNAPKGKLYQEAYDLKTGKPFPETMAMYTKMKAKIGQMGIPFID